MEYGTKREDEINLEEAYVESLQEEVKTLKQDIKDMLKCNKFLRCPNCERLHDNPDRCPLCGNRYKRG